MKKNLSIILIATIIFMTLFGFLACSGNTGTDGTDGEEVDTEPAIIGWIPEDQELRMLASWMTGRFESFDQYQSTDTHFHVHMRLKRIWNERTDAVYLYIEQAIEVHEGDFEGGEYEVGMTAPYRQRVYKLERVDENTIVSRVFDFNEETVDKDIVAGQWKKNNPLKTFTEDDIIEMEGCGVYLSLSEDGTKFEGGTHEQDCQTTYADADYAISNVTVTKDQLSSWDRFFYEDGTQLDHGIPSPYIFDKYENFNPELEMTETEEVIDTEPIDEPVDEPINEPVDEPINEPIEG